MSAAPEIVSLSLVSHTNAGKTTLARTLLGRDIGEVRDAPHVTEFADAHVLVETSAGDRLLLWDTPGFGDSVRLVRRLRQAEHPIGRFLSEVWDRWKDRPFWASQQAIRNTRDEADVLLYLVNASESVEAAGYVQPEMELLGWIGKPVVVLVNQLGARAAATSRRRVAQLARQRLGVPARARRSAPRRVRALLGQELTLFSAVEAALPEAKREAMARLRDAWRARPPRDLRFGRAGDRRQPGADRDDERDLARRRRRARPTAPGGAAIGIGSAEPGPGRRAQQSLAARLDDEVRANTRELLALHGLGGAAEGEIRERLAAGYDLRLRLDETQAAMWGGAVTGALVGLKADLLSGGLTLGGGLIAGGVLGALGSAGLARCVNLVRGTGRSFVTWNAAALDTMVEAALLRLLAVEHFGRGRGDWVRGEAPPHWAGVVAERARAAARGARRDLVGAQRQAARRRRAPRRAARADRERSGASVAATAVSGCRARLAVRPRRGVPP
jgi:hypothetical protein